MYASALTDPDGFGSALAIEVERLEDEHHGRMHAYAELCVPEAGVLRPSMMITWADVLCGSLANVYALPRITMTVDLDVRVVRPVPAGSDVHGIGRVRKSGARLAFTECAFTLADTGELVAFSAGSFMASPREQDQADVESAVRCGEGSGDQYGVAGRRGAAGERRADGDAGW